jgi:Tol biopolymer transport system component/tRNA A-37 threonylcarbamoyl transferase component Bud32
VIDSRIGSGGMGVIFRAQDPRLQRRVALKVLMDAAPDESLLREARAIAAVNHPNICTVHDIGRDGDVAYIAMELIDGQSLRDALAERPWTPMRVCRVGREMAEALEHAHAHGVVHRDFKPGNVMVTADGRVKVVDFGIALRTAVPDANTVTAAGNVASSAVSGTVAYMAPEVVQGSPADVRSDIWGLGVVLYELCTGKRPFAAPSTSALLAAIVRDRQPPLPPAVPAGLAHVIERCLAKDPLERPRRAGEVSLALEALQHSLARPGEVGTKARDRIGRTTLLAIAIGVLAALVAGGAWIVGRRTPPPGAPRFVNPIHVTTTEGVEEFPAWSPDGRMLAYATSSSGNATNSRAWDIWVVQAGGGAPVNRTADHEGRDLFPSWSPDGSQIAFWSDRDGGGCYVMPALAGAARRVAAASLVDPNPPQWSDDGQSLGCVSRTGEAVQLDVFALANGQPVERLALPGAGGRMFVTRSRDGGRVALVAASSGLGADLTALWTLDTATGRSRQLTDGQSKVWSPQWTADGRTLFYVAPQGATLDLWQQRLDAGGGPDGPPVPLTTAIGMRNAALSPDGRHLAYSQGRKVANIWRVPLFGDRAATWRDAEQVTFDQAFIEAIDLNRAATALVVSSDRAGSVDLWTLPAGGGAMTQLTSDPSAEWGPSFSPDGKQIAFFAHRTGNREIWTMPANGGAWQQITHDPAPELHPSWSPDSRSLVFFAGRAGASLGVVVPIAGGAERVINGRGFRWSPVDQRIAFNRDGRLFVTDLARGSDERPLASTGAGAPRWTPDGRYVLYRRDETAIAIVPSDGTGSERLVVDLSGRRGGLGDYGSPTDGRFVYFTWNDDVGDLWTLELAADVK